MCWDKSLQSGIILLKMKGFPVSQSCGSTTRELIETNSHELLWDYPLSINYLTPIKFFQQKQPSRETSISNSLNQTSLSNQTLAFAINLHTFYLVKSAKESQCNPILGEILNNSTFGIRHDISRFSIKLKLYPWSHYLLIWQTWLFYL